ncbi:MAG: Hsp70 family protein [Candidatus Riflebacteria bacterium]|nr:Hsp70 family protein [Candidatus Riflebacteria bacterium]
MLDARYVVGIDLGTTNTALAYLDTAEESPQLAVLPIEQLVAAGEVATRELLPSFIYIPGPHELPEGSLALPWDKRRDWAVGEFARDHGSRVAHRLVSSAKSWLCHPGVDRKSPILPWGASDDVQRISPLEASWRILAHLRECWNHRMAKDDPKLALENQQVVLTVPASFDAVARELTVEAARSAGLPQVTLLEEPQAAFYSWLEANPQDWREQIKVGDVALVCDIGGGTTDFCLISVADHEGSVELTRIAVGDHLLLGGDNMDLALALAVERKLADAGKTLDSWQLSVLVHQCRQAKELLLEDTSKGEAGVAIPGRGSSIVGGTIRAKLDRETLDGVIEGFFPGCEARDRPDESPQVGLVEWGLPYAPDARVTRWMARFLAEHRGAARSATPIQPTAVLFNGGVLRPRPLREVIRTVLTSWLTGKEGADATVRELPNPEPGLAVARGAAYYGLVRRGKGVRIRGGAPRSYYIGVEAARPAVPGVPAPLTAWCVLPRGTEEGSSAELPDREFALVVGQTARFRFFSSSTRTGDAVGTVVPGPEKALQEIDPVEATMPAEEGGGRVPVKLHTALTEVGTLELHFLDRSSDQRWKLEFSVREKPRAPETKSRSKKQS